MYANDVGLIRLNESIVFDEFTQPIDYSANELRDGATLTLTGWGRTSVSCIFVKVACFFLYYSFCF